MFASEISIIAYSYLNNQAIFCKIELGPRKSTDTMNEFKECFDGGKLKKNEILTLNLEFARLVIRDL